MVEAEGQNIKDIDEIKDLKIRRAAIVKALEIIRPILNASGTYGLFASSALLIHATENETLPFTASFKPGDLDMMVPNVEILNKIRTQCERYSRELGIIPLTPTQGWHLKRIPGEQAHIFAGRIITPVFGMNITVPFEIFAHSRLEVRDCFRHTTSIKGIQVFDLETLKDIYRNALHLEINVEKYSKPMIALLDETRIKSLIKKDIKQSVLSDPFVPTKKVQKIMEKTGLSIQELQRYYDADKLHDPKERMKKKVSIVSAGKKTKWQARFENITQLINAMSQKIIPTKRLNIPNQSKADNYRNTQLGSTADNYPRKSRRSVDRTSIAA